MKIALTLIGVFLAVLLIIPAFVSEDVTITRRIEINRPIQTVYDVVKDYNYYRQWNAWSQMDKNASGEISGPVGEVGAKWSWQGDTVGKGSLTIEELNNNKSIRSRLEFIEPMQMVARDLWHFESVEDSKTIVTWSYDATATTYMMRWANLMLDSQLGPDLERGLSNLKKLIENLPVTKPLELEMESGE